MDANIKRMIFGTQLSGKLVTMVWITWVWESTFPSINYVKYKYQSISDASVTFELKYALSLKIHT